MLQRENKNQTIYKLLKNIDKKPFNLIRQIEEKPTLYKKYTNKTNPQISKVAAKKKYIYLIYSQSRYYISKPKAVR